MAELTERPMARFTDQEILLVAMALNRGVKVKALDPKDDESASALTRLLGHVIDEELMVRQMDPRRMAEELFDRVLRTV